MRSRDLSSSRLLPQNLGLASAIAISVAVAMLGACGPAPEPVPPPPMIAPTVAVVAPPAPTFPPGWKTSPRVTAEHGMVVTDAALGTRVGLEILKAGGNAVDAAVATAFALAVVYPGAGNLGGGGFLVARMGSAEHTLDFRETAPAGASHDMYKLAAVPPGAPETAPAKPAKPAPRGAKAAKKPAPFDVSTLPAPLTSLTSRAGGDSREGHLAAGVPGSVAGLREAYDKLGSKKIPWADLIAPAIKLARDGFVVDSVFAKSITDNQKRIEKYAASRALFMPDGAPLKEGTTWKNPELATVLERIATTGPAGFYQGPTAELLVAEMKRGGGIITLADLASYRAKWRDPVKFTYRGLEVTSMGPPSSGGVTLGMMAHILEGYDLSKLAFRSPAELHLQFEAMRRAYVARNEKLGDPDFVTNPIPQLLSNEWATEQRTSIKPDRATPTSELPSAVAATGGAGPHTTNFSIVDGDGNAVALTTTINWFYGSGVSVAGAGFLLNNEMDDFASVPGTANGFGLVQGEPNSVAPGKRMLSSMSPSIVTDKGRVILVLGAAGGPTITTSVFLELSAVADHQLDVDVAVSAPRYHHQGLPDVVTIEKGGVPDDLQQALTAMGYTFKEREHIADAPAIGRAGALWLGAAEPRRGGGLALGY